MRVFAVSLAVATVFVVFGLYIGLYLTAQPASAVAPPSPQGGVQLYLATVPTDEVTDPHNTWVSYYQVNDKAQNWQHKTTFVLPAHTLVHITIFHRGWRVLRQRQADPSDQSRQRVTRLRNPRYRAERPASGRLRKL
jgi:hypothetical protein